MTRTRRSTEILAIVRDEIEPRLIGEDAFQVERCWQLARPATFDILRDRRLGLVACAGVDTAIWDAIGKALGQPLWRLWGGFRRRIQMIAIGGYYGQSLVEVAREMEGYRAAGPRRLQVQGRRSGSRRGCRAGARRARGRR